eukprot:superscaffoldBa00002282_g13757
MPDHLFKKMFLDSEIAKEYGFARTKTVSVVKTPARNDDECITEAMKRFPYNLATDGSTDMEDIKMYPIVVWLFDVSLGKVVVMLLKICSEMVEAQCQRFEVRSADGERVLFSADEEEISIGTEKLRVTGFIQSGIWPGRKKRKRDSERERQTKTKKAIRLGGNQDARYTLYKGRE